MTWLSRVQQASHVEVNLRNPLSGGSRISPRRGPNSPGEEGPTHDFAKISQKLHGI